MNDENTSLAKADSTDGLTKIANTLDAVSKFADENRETIHAGIELGGKTIDAIGNGFAELEKGAGEAVGAVGKGVGKAIGSVGDAVKIAAAAPAMIAKFRSEQQQLETMATVRLTELAGKYRAWAHAFDKEAAQRDRGLDQVEKALDKAIADGDREAMLKSLDALIGTLEKTDLTKHSSILTENWKGTTLTGPNATPLPNLLDDESDDYDPGI